MAKRTRQLGFYASLFDDVYERIVSQGNQGGKAEYFIQWKNYPLTENTWEPSEHFLC